MTYVHMHARDVGVTEIRTKAKAPDGSEIWVSDPKNSVERLASVLVIERRSTAARYMCTKCSLMFWGSKKRIKEHLRGQGNSVTGCVCVCVCVCVNALARACTRIRARVFVATVVCMCAVVCVARALVCMRIRASGCSKRFGASTLVRVCECAKVLLVRTVGRASTQARARTHTHTLTPPAHARPPSHKLHSCPHEPTVEEEEVMRADDPQGDADARYDRQIFFSLQNSAL